MIAGKVTGNWLTKSRRQRRDDGRRQLAPTQLAPPSHHQSIGLAIGAICGLAVGGLTAATAVTTAVTAAANGLVALSILRILLALIEQHLPRRPARLINRINIACAIGFAAFCGTLAALALLFDEHTHLQILLVTFALMFGAAIAVGNADMPRIAFVQLSLAIAPIVLACIIAASPHLLLAAAILITLSLVLAFVTLRVFSARSYQLQMMRESSKMALYLREQARTDSITGLANRIGFEDSAGQLIEAADPECSIALLWIDLHRFREVNDALGHATGDKVLCEIAARLRGLLPEYAALGRYGSDEFILLAALHHHHEVARLAENLQRTLAKPLRVDGHLIENGASIGVDVLGEKSRDLGALMEHADLALYHAKSAAISGDHNQLCFYNTKMTRNLARMKEMEAELRGALQRDELSVHYQPIIDLATGRIRAFEALVRWFHPERGELKPDEFIPVAEETGLIITLGNWVTRQAARACAGWPEDIRLAINLSPIQVCAPGAALGIINALKEARLDPARVDLEVTEHLFAQDDDATQNFMNQIGVAGIHLSLDDFGIGNSSLHYINKYPFRTIKVDRSFVSGPNIGKRSDAIIRAVAEMGATLGMGIVAEGLETAEQVRAMLRAGCTLGQGYHFSRAVPGHVAARLLAEEAERIDQERLAS